MNNRYVIHFLRYEVELFPLSSQFPQVSSYIIHRTKRLNYIKVGIHNCINNSSHYLLTKSV